MPTVPFLRPPPRWRPWIVTLLAWLALVALASAALWHLRRDDVNLQRRELQLLSLTLAAQAEHTLHGVHAGLETLRMDVHEGRLPSATTQRLRTHARMMTMVRTLWLLDTEGRVMTASDPVPPPLLAAFVPQAATSATPDTLLLSPPYRDAATGELRVAVALRGTSDWVVAALPAAALLGTFNTLLPGVDARMAIRRDDGVLLVGAIGPAADTGTGHLVSRHAVAGRGVTVEVSRDMATVLRSWREAAELVGAALALVLLVSGGAMALVQRADRRRHEAQLALQAQLGRASRLESLGTLAGGVAHDFNNVLAGIVGFGEMAQDAAVPGSAQARHLDRVMQAALRGRALVERVLAFSRGGARQSVVFELAPVVEEVLALLAASLRPGVVLEHRLEAPGARLRGDPTRAFEAVMNLCTNALQAMPDGGMLSVRLQRTVSTTDRVLSHSGLPAGPHLTLTVHDQGSGITPEVMEHLFEPFFTTRSGRSGTGLGLAVVHGVVAEFGGGIDVQSVPGQGACFTLYLPESSDPPDTDDTPDAAVPPGAHQAVLVVDDEPSLVALADELLRGLGYEPVAVTDPAVALQMVRDDPTRFAAVVTDEVMPGLTGTQLTEALRPLAPHLPVLLVSGFGGPLLAQRATAAGVHRLMTKPLRRSELARALAELLH